MQLVFKWIYLCVCVYVCVFMSIHREGFISLEQLGLPGNRSTMLRWKTLDSSAGSLHLYFGMQNITFQRAALSCSYAISGHSHDLTSIRLACRTSGLHSPLTGVAFSTHYIVSRSAFASALTRGFAIYLGKVKVTANFSIKSSPR